MQYIHTALFILVICWSPAVRSQVDSTPASNLPEITVRAYFKEQPLLTSPASISTLSGEELALHSQNSLVGAVNTIPGVRMEERSPSSYRLSIRGSVLRSPFGIRNIKIYLSDFCLTDAGGNSYLNLLDPAGVGRIDIIKGPEGSVYGANTGGVMIIDPIGKSQDSFKLSTTAEAGSYGYVQGKVQFQDIWRKLYSNISVSYLRADGYRRNSGNEQWTAQVLERYQYSPKANLKLYLLFSDLSYHTPGGLTLAQYNADPLAARPATPTFPGAVTQKAAIYNTSILGGLSHEVKISDQVRNVTSVTVSHTAFQNPFITNYEVRNENNVTLRSYFDWSKTKNERLSWSLVNGIEGQQFLSSIVDYGNNKGAKDSVQTSYRFNAGQYFVFSKFSIELIRRVTLEGGLSVNYNWYQYKSVAPVIDGGFTNITLSPQLMPRVAISVLITNGLAWRASVSRGYSPPTIAELHPSAQVVSTGLQPERGWNYETGFGYRELHGYVTFDVVAFYYQLDHAISMRSDSAGNSFFINAGGTRQIGLEAQVSAYVLRPTGGRLNTALQLHGSYTYDHFRFGDYRSGTADYSGKYLTGVPPHVLVAGLTLDMPLGFYLFSEYTYTSNLPLNDANNAWARHYNLLQAKIGWRHAFHRFDIELYAGANNLLNEKYSLGNDLNAAGGRYYNAAAARNYFGGVKFSYGKR